MPIDSRRRSTPACSHRSDLNDDGRRTLPQDAFGFGAFPGQYGMLVLSQYPLDRERVRTFAKFRWRDLPGAKLPVHPERETSWYSPAALEVFRLSSKSHWDLPLKIRGTTLHLLVSQPHAARV